MKTTRDRILATALRLFARDGYEATSTSAIAGELGMAKSALYKHFSDKRAIFDSLVDEMLARHREAGAGLGLASGPAQDAALAYAGMAPAEMADLGEALFRHWTANEHAAAFRRMLSIERFRDGRAAEVYDELFVTGPMDYNAAVLAAMIEAGALAPGDATQMALDFWAPVHLLMQAVDCGMGQDEATALVRNHVLSFAQSHARNRDA